MQVVGHGDLIDTAVLSVGIYLDDGTPNTQHEALLSTAQLVQPGKACELLSAD